MSAVRATADQPSYPEIKAAIGEDPARFLGLSELYLARARIAAIDSMRTLNSWRAVERQEFGGRESVMDALDDRAAVLRGDGDE